MDEWTFCLVVRFDCLRGDSYHGDVRGVGVVSSVGGDVLEC